MGPIQLSFPAWLKPPVTPLLYTMLGSLEIVCFANKTRTRPQKKLSRDRCVENGSSAVACTKHAVAVQPGKRELRKKLGQETPKSNVNIALALIACLALYVTWSSRSCFSWASCLSCASAGYKSSHCYVNKSNLEQLQRQTTAPWDLPSYDGYTPCCFNI